MRREPAYFDHLQHLLQLERDGQRRRFEELRATLSPEEQLARGMALADLEAVDESFGLGGRLLVTMEREDRSPLGVGIDVGAPVLVRPRRSDAEVPVPAVVARRSRTSLVLAFDEMPPPFVAEGRLWIDLAADEVTFARARDAVRTVQGWEKGVLRRRRDTLLGAEPARFDTVQPLPAIALNPEQRDAVERGLAAQDFFLVHGPPGTGKSTVLGEIAVQAVARGERLLATAASNAAVDHLLELCLARGLRVVRVGHPARVAERLQEHTLDLLVEADPDRKVARDLFDDAFELQGYARKQRSRGRSRDRFANAREAQGEARRLFAEARRLEKRAVRAVLARAQVICATCTALAGSTLREERFDRALLDEATQAIEPLSLLPFLRAERVILAGDHRQLPPTVISQEAGQLGLSVSLFERLLGDHGDGVRRMLREQYRMNERIMSFPSAEMYGGELRAHPSVAGRRLDLPGVESPPLLFVDTAGKGFEEEAPPQSDSLANPGEAALVLARARELIEAGLPAAEVAVIAPYSAQVALLRDGAMRQGLSDAVEIDTVDAFQGREKDAILLSLTRSNADGTLGFLADLRRMNVAITRARRHLFVVGDSATLAHHPFYQRFVAGAEAHGGWRSAWEWPEPAPL
ncbi:AAA domain-containing protein [Vulgatibacter sp.]|uniref:AAA domain-containing protein n=1 Tax=Vulgatibacter sp. TaxID=1971226 RepID=UPI0035664522